MANQAAIAVCFFLFESALALSCRTASAAFCGTPTELTRLFDGVMANLSSSGGCVSSSLSPPLASKIPDIQVMSVPAWDHKNRDLLEVKGKCTARLLFFAVIVGESLQSFYVSVTLDWTNKDSNVSAVYLQLCDHLQEESTNVMSRTVIEVEAGKSIFWNISTCPPKNVCSILLQV